MATVTEATGHNAATLRTCGPIYKISYNLS